MRIIRDRRSVEEQAKSGVKIAGSMLATVATLTLIAIAYLQITKSDSRGQIFVGWLLMAFLVVMLSATVQFWCKWFYFLPGFAVMRLSLWAFFGWVSPRGYILIGLFILMVLMGIVSYRFSKLARILATDRVALILALACFLGSVAAAISAEPKLSALVLAGLGDLILLFQWAVIRQHLLAKRRRTAPEALSIPHG